MTTAQVMKNNVKGDPEMIVSRHFVYF